MGAALGLVAGLGLLLVGLALTGAPPLRRESIVRPRVQRLLRSAGIETVTPLGLGVLCAVCGLVVAVAVLGVSRTPPVALAFGSIAAYGPVGVDLSSRSAGLGPSGWPMESWPFFLRGFDKAMGIAVGADRVAVAGKGQIWSLRDHSELAAAIQPAGRYDRCWLPRSSTVTGGIQCHEIAWGTSDRGGPDLWIVNTLFSYLAGLDPDHSFVPR